MRWWAVTARGSRQTDAGVVVVALEEQLSRPHGALGLVAGELLAWRNRGLNRWTIGLLALEPASRVLEIGFGPGVGVRIAASRARRGMVAGVDPSAVMVRRASVRSRRAVAAGRALERVAATRQ